VTKSRCFRDRKGSFLAKYCEADKLRLLEGKLTKA
jgi:hypothetical protein